MHQEVRASSRLDLEGLGNKLITTFAMQDPALQHQHHSATSKAHQASFIPLQPFEGHMVKQTMLMWKSVHNDC